MGLEICAKIRQVKRAQEAENRLRWGAKQRKPSEGRSIENRIQTSFRSSWSPRPHGPAEAAADGQGGVTKYSELLDGHFGASRGAWDHEQRLILEPINARRHTTEGALQSAAIPVLVCQWS